MATMAITGVTASRTIRPSEANSAPKQIRPSSRIALIMPSEQADVGQALYGAAALHHVHGGRVGLVDSPPRDVRIARSLPSSIALKTDLRFSDPGA
jgi:hypothetical protein